MASRPNFFAIGAMTLVLKIQLNQLPPSCALAEAALIQGVYSVAD